MPHSTTAQNSTVQSPSFRRLTWGLLVVSWACALVSIGFSFARWAAIGHKDWGHWMPVTVVPTQALVAGLVPPQSMETPWRWVGVALECLPGLALLAEIAVEH